MLLDVDVGLSPRDFVLDENPAPPQKGGGAPKFWAHVYYSYCGFVRTLHSREAYWFVQVQVLVLYAFYFWKKSLVVLSLFQYKDLNH